MKKKTIRPKLPNISADQIAANLRKSFPANPFEKKNKALEIARYYASALDRINAADINEEILTIEESKKNARTWAQVVNILSKK